MLGSKYFRNSWENYGNQYADYCPISLSEKEAKAHYKIFIIGKKRKKFIIIQYLVQIMEKVFLIFLFVHFLL